MAHHHPTDDESEHSIVQLPLHEMETTSRLVHRDNIASFSEILAASRQTPDWSQQTLGMSTCWSQHSVSGAGVVVAILDTGIDPNHEDLAGAIREGANFVGGSDWIDRHGHGTHCAGIVAARNNTVGIVGMAPSASLIIGKVLGDDGSGTLGGIARAIDWAVSRGAHVISLSLGGSGSTTGIFRQSIDKAVAAGRIVVVAAGNSGLPKVPRTGNVDSPGNYTPCVTVGACSPSLAIAPFSSRGPEVDIVAPGVNIVSCAPGQRYVAMSGTSMATPIVAGIAALFVEKCRALGIAFNQLMFENYVKRTARDLGTVGFDNSFGFGLIQPTAILSALVRDAAGIKKAPLPPTRSRLIADDAAKHSITTSDHPVNVSLTLEGGKVIAISGVVKIDVSP